MKKTAQVVLINPEGLVLGVSRKNDHNDFGLAGGKMEDIDNDNPETTAIRETFEETGLKISNLRLVFAIHKDGYMGYTYLADYEGGINHNEPHVVKWVPFEVLVNGSFGRYNELVSESLLDMGINFCFNINIEQLSEAVKVYINDYFKTSDITFSFLRKDNGYYRDGYVVYLTSDEPEYLDEAVTVPESFDKALEDIGKKFGVWVHLSSDYCPK